MTLHNLLKVKYICNSFLIIFFICFCFICNQPRANAYSKTAPLYSELEYNLKYGSSYVLSDNDMANLQKEIDLNPYASSFYSRIAENFINKKDDQKALEVLNKSLFYNPNVPKTYLLIAFINFEEKDYKEAVLNLKKTISIRSITTEDFYVAGIAYQKLGDSQKAVDSLQKALLRERNNPHICQMLGVSYMADKKYKLAEYYLKESIVLDPNIPDIYISLGTLYEKIHQFNNAMISYKKANELLSEESRYDFTSDEKSSFDKKNVVRAGDFFRNLLSFASDADIYKILIDNKKKRT